MPWAHIKANREPGSPPVILWEAETENNQIMLTSQTS